MGRVIAISSQTDFGSALLSRRMDAQSVLCWPKAALEVLANFTPDTIARTSRIFLWSKLGKVPTGFFSLPRVLRQAARGYDNVSSSWLEKSSRPHVEGIGRHYSCSDLPKLCILSPSMCRQLCRWEQMQKTSLENIWASRTPHPDLLVLGWSMQKLVTTNSKKGNCQVTPSHF